jgi:hypothetical protein
MEPTLGVHINYVQGFHRELFDPHVERYSRYKQVRTYVCSIEISIAINKHIHDRNK